MMCRTSLLLLFLLASGVAAGTGAQEPPHATAPARVVDLRRMQPISEIGRAHV